MANMAMLKDMTATIAKVADGLRGANLTNERTSRIWPAGLIRERKHARQGVLSFRRKCGVAAGFGDHGLAFFVYVDADIAGGFHTGYEARQYEIGRKEA